MAEALNDEITVELATKSDLRALEAALNSEIAGVRTEIEELRTELRTEIAAVRTELAVVAGRLEARIENMSGEIVKWSAG